MNTLPVGLCGELSSTSRVRLEKAARSSSGSNAYRPSGLGRRVTARSVPWASAMQAAYES